MDSLLFYFRAVTDGFYSKCSVHGSIHLSDVYVFVLKEHDLKGFVLFRFMKWLCSFFHKKIIYKNNVLSFILSLYQFCILYAVDYNQNYKFKK